MKLPPLVFPGSANGVSTVVKHSPHHGKAEGSIPAAVVGIGMGVEKMEVKKLLFVTSYHLHPSLKFADPGSPPLRLVYNICENSAKLVRLKEQLKIICIFKSPFSH